jgi:hypothetical protein
MAENGIFIKLDPWQMEHLEIHFLEALHKVSKERDEARKWARRMVRERDEIKTKAQEQSEIIQRDWISPAEKMGMEDKIIELTKERDIINNHYWRLVWAINSALDNEKAVSQEVIIKQVQELVQYRNETLLIFKSLLLLSWIKS